MGGFFRKVAGAFIYMDEPAKSDRADGADGSAESSIELDAVSRDASELIAQLGNTPDAAAGGKGGKAPSPPGATDPAASVIDMTAEHVFAQAGFVEAATSAPRLLKIIAGLSMFPKDQQIAMVRAMDAADESWSEQDVLADARNRQSALRAHTQAVEAERTARLTALAERVAAAEAQSKRRLSEVDQQLTELHKLRDDVMAATASTLSDLDVEKRQVEAATDKARRGISAVINALSELITFFSSSDSRAAKR
jgi:hypothetical protein